MEGRDIIVVLQWHGLAATVDDRFLGERSFEVADGRAGLVDPPIEPRFVDEVVLVVIALEVVDDDEVLRGETPDAAFPGFGFLELGDLPVVRGAEIQRIRDVAVGAHGVD